MPEQNSTSHPTPEQSTKTLHESLKTIHPAHIWSGMESLVQFITDQMRDPNWIPPYGPDSSFSELEEVGRTFLSSQRLNDSEDEFRNGLLDYAKLLHAVHIKLYELQSYGAAGALEAADEIVRIADPLGINVFDEDVEAHGLLRESALAPAQKPTAFDRCAQFDETLRRYQKNSESLLRGFSLRVSDLVQRCSARIVPAQREAAGVLNRKIETAVEAIKAQ